MPYPMVFLIYLQNPLCNRSKIFSTYFFFIFLSQKDAKYTNLALTKTNLPRPCLIKQ